MRRLACAFLSVSMASGCVSTRPETDYGASVAHWGGKATPGNVPGVCAANRCR